jgi:uncharacterized protein YegJ (DUF2314 family)
MSENFSVRDIVDADNVYLGIIYAAPQKIATDASETVNGNSNRHDISSWKFSKSA